MAGSVLIAATTAQAVQGLELSLQCSNVVMSWPSADYESYIVQYRPSLNVTDQWQTLESWLPSGWGTNRTYYVHANIVTNANCGTGNGLAQAIAMAATSAEPAPLLPLAVRTDGTSSAVPVTLYPPGFDLTGFIIIDPVTGATMDGAGYTVPFFSASFDGLSPTDPPPLDGGGTGSGVANQPETGFYRVVKRGITVFGITNGITLSGTVTFPVEIGTDYGNIAALAMREDGAPVGNSQSVAPFNLPLQLTLDTTTMSNGTHMIAAYASWNSGGDEGTGDGVDAESDVFTVNVQNEITFPNWIEHCGELYDTVLFTAQSAHPDADWYVDVYGSDSGYIGTFGDHTPDGEIYFWWDLIGPPPQYRSYNTERYFDFVVTTVWSGQAQGNGPMAAGGTGSAIRRTYRQTDNWTSRGMWVVANQQAWNDLTGSEWLDLASDGFAGMAEDFGLTVRPTRTAKESYRIGYGEEIPITTRNAQWTELRAALYHPESRNFFYFGHGDPDRNRRRNKH